ncbi:serine/threonine-protein kinase [Streptomyces sp. NPDC013178]|uniref:serine/threonine-protein kinase n=1 Tax=unclassified Streptomyces TaxID=2593676 RepID=UPI0033FF54DE
MTAVRIGPYVVERELGAGGMGTVYLARSRAGRPVAVKVARPELAADPSFRARFRAEIEAARRVGGFHTAPVVDADPDGTPPWLATAYVPGPTLAARLEAEGPMGEGELRRLGAALAEALQAIHGCGLVHRDLKPGNIVMAADGPRVLDFGIARAVENTRLTATGHAFGTPGFLAPEQAVGRDVTGAADVFALGAVLVAAAGGRPFGDGTPMALMYRSVHEEADVTALPAALRDVVAACLAKDPADRPTPGGLLDLLTAPAPAGAPPAYPPKRYAPRQEPWGAGPRPAPPEGPAGPGGPADPRVASPTPAPPAVAPSAPTPSAPAPSAPTPSAAERARADSLRTFTVADGRQGVAVYETGVLLQVGEVEVEFAWGEIAAVITTASGFGRGFAVTVRPYEGDDCSVDVRAPTRRIRDQWLARLDLVLARYLDE